MDIANREQAERWNSGADAATESAKNISPNREMTASKLPGSNG